MEKKEFIVEQLTTDYLISIGVPAKLSGFEYLRLAVKLVVANPRMLDNITKMLYPKIAEIMQTKVPAIERSMRHAIEVAFESKGLYHLNAIYGCVLYKGDRKPTNSELIALLAEKIEFEVEKALKGKKIDEEPVEN